MIIIYFSDYSNCTDRKCLLNCTAYYTYFAKSLLTNDVFRKYIPIAQGKKTQLKDSKPLSV